MQEESLWQEDFDNLYFLNILNKTHQSILVFLKHFKQHHQIYISKTSTMFTITKWSQDQCTREKIPKKKKNPHYIPHKHSP